MKSIYQMIRLNFIRKSCLLRQYTVKCFFLDFIGLANEKKKKD